jgi:hypothetical protein
LSEKQQEEEIGSVSVSEEKALHKGTPRSTEFHREQLSSVELSCLFSLWNSVKSAKVGN